MLNHSRSYLLYSLSEQDRKVLAEQIGILTLRSCCKIWSIVSVGIRLRRKASRGTSSVGRSPEGERISAWIVCKNVTTSGSMREIKLRGVPIVLNDVNSFKNFLMLLVSGNFKSGRPA